MADDDVEYGRFDQSGEFKFPQPGAVSVRSAVVGGDENPAGVGVFFFTHLLPPFFDSGDGEDRRVVVDTDRDPGAVVGQVVDPVWNCFAVSLTGEVIDGHLDRLTLRMPFSAGLGEPSDQLLFLSIDADHGVAAGEEIPGEGINVPELGVPSGCWFPSRVLRVPCRLYSRERRIFATTE